MVDRKHAVSRSAARQLDDASLEGVVGGAPSHSQCEPDDGSGTGSSDSGADRSVRPVLIVIANQDFYYQG